MGRIYHYLAVYREFLATSIAEATSYRAHFVLLVVMDLFFYASTLGSAGFIFDHVEAVGTWGRDPFLFFLSFMLAVDQLHMTFVSVNFWVFSQDLRIGALDFILLRPLAAPFTVFFRHVRPASLLNMPVPWLCLAYFGHRVGLAAWAWAALPLLVLLALGLMVSIEILLSMSMFWIVESMGINFLRMQLQQVARWPDQAYRYAARKAFTIVIPVLLIGSAPVRLLLHPADWRPFAGMILATVACWAATRALWRLGLRAYESASS